MHLTARLGRPRDGQRGAVLVITTAAMFTVLVIAAFVIDVAIWYVHGKHLQTEADAAALAGAQLFSLPCTSGATSPGTTDNAIQTTVNQYDGTTAPPTGTYYNPQVNLEPTPATLYSPTAHNLFSELNAPQFENQNLPNPGDSLTGSPCKDSVIDVKMSETNVPSFFPFSFVSPSYIDREAEVSIENLTSISGGLTPLAEPLPTPSGVTAYLIDESNPSTPLATVNLVAVAGTADASWQGTTSLAFNATGPISMEIATSPTGVSGGGSVPCPPPANSNDNCYDTADSPNIGVTYTRVWKSGSPNYPLTAPEVDDATVTPSPDASACPGGAGTPISNFISTSTPCTVTLSANLNFGTAATCANAGAIAVTYNGTTVPLTLPACSSSTASPNGTWTSGDITVGSSTGKMNLTLGWTSTTNMTTPIWAQGGSSGKCTGNGNNVCTFSFGVVQRIFSGAYDDQSAATSNSGPVLAASVVGPSGPVQSIQNSNTSETITLNVTFESFQNSNSATQNGGVIESTTKDPPIELAFGGNQANALVSCPSTNAGNNTAQSEIWLGCQPPNNNFELDPNPPGSGACTPAIDPTTGAYYCIATNPGSKLDANLDPAMSCKINGSSTTAPNCTPNVACNSPNYWAVGNTLSEIEHESPPDHRLLTLFTTDNQALGNGRTEVPIRVITDFYVTGWAPIVNNGPNKNVDGDPCLSAAPGTGTSGTNTVAQQSGGPVSMKFVPDTPPSASDADPPGVLLGHFVQDTVIGTGTGSGKCVQQNALGNCIGILTK